MHQNQPPRMSIPSSVGRTSPAASESSEPSSASPASEAASSEDSFVIEETVEAEVEADAEAKAEKAASSSEQNQKRAAQRGAAAGDDQEEGGELNQDLMNLCRRAFQEFENGSGFLLTRDLGSALRAVGQVPTEVQVQLLTQRLEQGDLYDKGFTKLTFQEFYQAAQDFKVTKADAKKSVMDAFSVFDKDNSGLIDANRLVSILASLGESLTPADTKEMLKELPVDKNGKVDYARFVEDAINCEMPGATAGAKSGSRAKSK